ncbi:MAG TPA: sigma-70 family RNA polymerase sigma factor [Polyangiaceae bacterium]|nr:sigma-70 family RNA polymerase sigma factor [Polyangiaceae bacterium]
MRFRELYEEHFAFVWRSLRRLGVPESSLKDGVQDVFLVVHRRLAEFEGRAKISTWLFRICIRVARDQRRRAHLRREVLDDSGVLSYADPQADTAGASERNDDLVLFEQALQRLPLEQRTVFILFELEAMTGEEIAEALAIPLGTVYSRLRLARVTFRRAVLRAPGERQERARQGKLP